jgi:branched-chain amino acid transport system substrate-binding protein
MRALGVHSVYVLDDQNPFQAPLAALVAADAERDGISVAGRDSLPVAGASVFTGEVEKIMRTGAQAVFFAGGPDPGAIDLWRAMHAADPRLVLLGSSALLSESFTAAIGPAQGSTFLTSPVLSIGSYPPAAARMLSDYRRHFGGGPGPYALYGYEAMSVVLAAIRRAGARANNRQAVIESFFATRNRASVLGSYSVLSDGETTLSRYGVDRVQNGRAVFYRAINVG